MTLFKILQALPSSNITTKLKLPTLNMNRGIKVLSVLTNQVCKI